MSDQTEWTVTDFGQVRLNGKDMVTALTYDQGKALVDAIKVALTAEREKVRILEDSVNDFTRSNGALTTEVLQLREQLEEETKTSSDALEAHMLRAAKLQTKLAAHGAAIEHVKQHAIVYISDGECFQCKVCASEWAKHMPEHHEKTCPLLCDTEKVKEEV